ncbi:MAG: hypothetical protein VKO00_05315 [Cyanobacteriota bacterium]|nr:hypothetical protein [Cyanobacteriota bacterium]
MVDRVDYLDSLGRARLAEVLRDAAIAEAEAFSEADQVEAQAEERSEVASSRARTLAEESSNGLRRVCAELDGLVRSAEEGWRLWPPRSGPGLNRSFSTAA